LLGQWQYTYVSNATYTGVVVVGAQGSAKLTATWSGGQFPSGTVSQSGYVRPAMPEVEFIFTAAAASNGHPYNPDHFHCTMLSSNALDCYNVDTAGSTSAKFILSRIAAPR